MGVVAKYEFKEFPYLSQGSMQLKDGVVTVEEGRGGWIIRECHLDGLPSVGCATRAVIDCWLHRERGHDLGIRRKLAERAAER
jgi:hypothetical protein